MDKPVKKPSKKRLTSFSRRLKISRRFFVVGSTTLLVASLAGFGVYSQYVWGQYVDQSKVTYGEIRDSTRKELSGEISKKTIERLSSDLADQADSLCSNLPVFGELRIQLFDSARDHQAECDSRVKLISNAADAARQFGGYLSTEGAAALIYDDLHDSLSDAKPDEYRARQGAWRQAKVKLELLAKADTDYADQITDQLSLVDDIVARYSEQIKANKAQKRLDFDTATAKLQDAYDNLNDVSEDQKAYHDKQVKDFIAIIEKL